MRFFPAVPAFIPFALVSAQLAAQPVVATPAFEATKFFAGRTEGRGVLKVALSPKRDVIVHGSGRVEPDGTLILDQVVEREGKQPEQRQWRIKEVAAGRYTGTLTDARGPVTGVVNGNVLKLRYRLKNGGLAAEQSLRLQPDGRTVLNRMEVSKFGITVAELEETIRKLD
jgi:hypothetical protein